MPEDFAAFWRDVLKAPSSAAKTVILQKNRSTFSFVVLFSDTFPLLFGS